MKVSMVILRKIDGCFNFYASFMEVLRVFQEKLWGVPRDLQEGSFKGVSWQFHGSFKYVLRKFQGWLKKVLSVFQGNFKKLCKGVSRMFQKSSPPLKSTI